MLGLTIRNMRPPLSPGDRTALGAILAVVVLAVVFVGLVESAVLR